jgi:predicted transcriptional regulator
MRRREILMQNTKKYRNRTEIIHDILQTARNDGNGVGKTRIMYSAFLSYNQIKEYLTVLIDNSLLHYDLSTQKFKLTEKGLNFLQLCEKLGDLIEEETPINPRSW